MILKRLTATGFKSFADKTEFDFGPGITCIVGPNGCGKSNVVDAVKWVLGEQSAKSLRGKQMMDVIFNEVGSRQSAGMAQVDLTFDNSDGRLPIDQTEVVVTRRLYRSGESEYLLNRQTARLKDIRELFLDTGIGVDAYSLIEQGRVDQLLQSNPHDRRLIFEEAAGISKYKLRKKEAQRRLENVDQNLLRIQDIIDEVEKRLRSVKLAAGKARNYQAYRQQLQVLRSRYALSEYHGLRTQWSALEAEVAARIDEATRLRTDLSDNEARATAANVRVNELEREISQLDGRVLTLQSQITAQQERSAAAERRIADQSDLLAKSRDRLANHDGQVSALRQRLDEQQQAAAAIESELSAVQDRLAGLQESDRACGHELNLSQRRLEDENAGIIELLRRTSQLRNEIQAVTLQQETLSRQKAQLDERGAQIDAALSDTVARRQQWQDRLEEIDRLLADQRAALEETRARATAASERQANLLDQHAAAKEYRSGLYSRRQLLEEMDRRHEGLLTGAREILRRRDADESGGTFGYVLGAVGELFEADVAHASMVEAALGAMEKYLVVAGREQLLRDRETLTELSGGVQAFCLDAVAPALGGPDLRGQEGVIAALLDWVRYPPICEKLARYLFARTWVVESLDQARALSALDPVARFVTMEGVVWEADGRISLGSLGSDTGLISRRSELRELGRELGEVERRIATLAEQLHESESEVDHLEIVQQDLRTAIYQVNTERVEVQSQLATVEESLRQLREEQPLIASEMSILVGHLQEARVRETAGRETLTQLEERNRERERAVEELKQEIEHLHTRRAEISEELTSARVRVGELNARRSSSAEAIRQLQAEQIRLEAERDKAARDVVEAEQRIEHSRRQIEEARRALAGCSAEHDELVRQSSMRREERDGLRQAIETCAVEARQLRARLEETEADLHARQMKLNEVRVRAEELVSRIAEELGVDLEQQYEGYVPEAEENWPAVEAEIEELRQKIERLGNVNLDAIEEQAELEKRHEFLSGQYHDLRASEKQLQALIEKLNEESRQRFLETFQKVSENFSALFKKLFGGGRAEVRLLDGNDPLECGIEIIARPPGKPEQSISLLSGGEKAMTAIALLLAVMRNRPSPFVVMDEVDAPLDEANNIRFNNVIREFARESQFLIITHSKRTMSMADTLYGVTMQEAGVSKRVSVRFDDERPQHAVA